MQPDAEHQQDDADLGQFVGELLVGDVARRERPDHDAGQQIADQRREPQALRGESERNARTRPTTTVEINGVLCSMLPSCGMRRLVATLGAATDCRSKNARAVERMARDINGCQSPPKSRIIAAADVVLICSLARFGTS